MTKLQITLQHYEEILSEVEGTIATLRNSLSVLSEQLKTRKLRLRCLYCAEEYRFIKHKHTHGFHEHILNPNCRFYQHKIFEVVP